jgi:hypothetical protein
MANTVTFRLDLETARILRELTRRENGSKSRAIKRALREHWQQEVAARQPSAWEIYSQQTIPPATGRRHNRAKNAGKLFREYLLAKKRRGTL